MALVNHPKREINTKIVYFGPGLSGKSTNLKFIFKKLKPEHRGNFKMMDIEKDKMLFFDFMPVSPSEMKGYALRFHIYTLMGETSLTSSWKVLLKGADGIVFVADSDPTRMDANIESMQDLLKYCESFEKSLQEIPLVIQCNKRDAISAVSLNEMRDLMQAGDARLIPSVASTGEGVLDTLFTIVKMVQRKLREGGLGLERGAEQVDETTQIDVRNIVPQPACTTTPSDEEYEFEAPLLLASGRDQGQIASEPILEISENPESFEGGVRLPLVVRYGSHEKRFSLSVALSVIPQ